MPGVYDEIVELHVDRVQRILNGFEKRAVLHLGPVQVLFRFALVPEGVLCMLLFIESRPEGIIEKDDGKNACKKDRDGVGFPEGQGRVGIVFHQLEKEHEDEHQGKRMPRVGQREEKSLFESMDVRDNVCAPGRIKRLRTRKFRL
nr:hypothetical protein [uncultured Methanoregula sp.]